MTHLISYNIVDEMSIIDFYGKLWRDGFLVEEAPTFITTSQLDPRLAITTDGQLYDIELLKIISNLKFKSIINHRLMVLNGYRLLGILDNGDLYVAAYHNGIIYSHRTESASLSLLTSIIIYRYWHYVAYSNDDGWISIEILLNGILKIDKIIGGPDIKDVISVRDGVITTAEHSYTYSCEESNQFFSKSVITPGTIYQGIRYRRVQYRPDCKKVIVTDQITIKHEYIQIDDRIMNNHQLSRVIHKTVGLYRYKDTHIIVLADGRSYYLSNVGDTVKPTKISWLILKTDWLYPR